MTNDDASLTALVMEIARILSAPEVTTERSIRFALWNSEDRPRIDGEPGLHPHQLSLALIGIASSG